MADRTLVAALALHRFGFGPKSGDKAGSIAAMAGDPRGALLAEIDKPGAGQVTGGDLASAAVSFRAVADANAERQAKQALAARAQREKEKGKEKEAERIRLAGKTATDAGDAAMMGKTPAMAPAPMTAEPAPPDVNQQIYLREVKARVDAALAADIGFAERLVWFWSNHFCISANKIQSMAGAYEREAIRPHALGRFEDLLLAAESHPAMLFYLDNQTSVGPGSTAGINRNRGLNENLAREILELHTLGVRTGYSQDDVTAFAKVLTGWTLYPVVDNPDHGGEFVFNKRLHEPGPQRIMGREYADDGVEQGRRVLRDVARHPATATHVATKLARHFVADEPPPTLVAKLEKAFRDSDGDLKQVARALVAADEAWAESRTKLKRPGEWVTGFVRASGVPAEPGRFASGQGTLGEGIWRVPSPKGHADIASAWVDGIGQRLDIANSVAQRIAERTDPAAVLETALGPLATSATRTSIARAESRQQALALLFMAPEMLRR